MDRLRTIRTAKVKAAYLESLHAKAKVTFGLDVPRIEISVKNAALRGSADAPIMLVEYADYECPILPTGPTRH